jgi:hypothetical protein
MIRNKEEEIELELILSEEDSEMIARLRKIMKDTPQ